jgi:Ribonuclease G/E
VIGSGGKVIRSIVEESGAKVDINDDGLIKIASPDGAAIEKAKELIMSIAAEPEVGKIYTGKVVKIMDFGAFVNFFGKRDGLVHVSQMTRARRQPQGPREGGPGGEGQADGLRRPRQDAPVDEGRRPEDRRPCSTSLKNHRQAGGVLDCRRSSMLQIRVARTRRGATPLSLGRSPASDRDR